MEVHVATGLTAAALDIAHEAHGGAVTPGADFREYVVVGHESALMRAVRQGDAQGLAMVQALLQHGHSPDSLEVQYARVWDTGVPVALITPLYVAAQNGHYPVVKFRRALAA